MMLIGTVLMCMASFVLIALVRLAEARLDDESEITKPGPYAAVNLGNMFAQVSQQLSQQLSKLKRGGARA